MTASPPATSAAATSPISYPPPGTKGRCHQCGTDVIVAHDGGCPYCARPVGKPITREELIALEEERERELARDPRERASGHAIIGLGISVAAVAFGSVIFMGSGHFGAVPLGLLAIGVGQLIRGVIGMVTADRKAKEQEETQS